jgi:predicted transglutaminase-like cysteine proteinase
MGRAKITAGGPTGLYDVEIVKDTAPIVKRITAIDAQLVALATQLTAATDALDAATSAHVLALAALDSALSNYISDQTKEKRDALTAAQTAAASKSTARVLAQRALTSIKTQQASLTKEKTTIQAAMATEARTGIWCTDLTEDLAAGVEVGTMEVNGEASQIILTPAGATASALGKLRPTQAMTPAGVFYNKALMPCWQKWKPTYRIGTLTSIDYENDKCTLIIGRQVSSEQGLRINQGDETGSVERTAVTGWIEFAALNPTFPLVTNTGDSQITMSAQVRADLASVQSEVNNRNTYKTDTTLYGKLEKWSLMEEGGSGDCEDFALTKAQKLLDKGYPASAIKIEVGKTKQGEGHAWLVVQTTGGDIALDINYKDPMNNDAIGYSDRSRQTGMDWSVKGVILTNVSIEYMNGLNSSVFQINDRVVVQFVGQNWATPKVIGFETNPRGSVRLLRVDFGGVCGYYDTLRQEVIAGPFYSDSDEHDRFYHGSQYDDYKSGKPYWEWAPKTYGVMGPYAGFDYYYDTLYQADDIISPLNTDTVEEGVTYQQLKLANWWNVSDTRGFPDGMAAPWEQSWEEPVDEATSTVSADGPGYFEFALWLEEEYGAATDRGTIEPQAKFPAADAGDYYLITSSGLIGGTRYITKGYYLFCKTNGTPEGTEGEVGAHWSSLVERTARWSYDCKNMIANVLAWGGSGLSEDTWPNLQTGIAPMWDLRFVDRRPPQGEETEPVEIASVTIGSVIEQEFELNEIVVDSVNNFRAKREGTLEMSAFCDVAFEAGYSYERGYDESNAVAFSYIHKPVSGMLKYPDRIYLVFIAQSGGYSYDGVTGVMGDVELLVAACAKVQDNAYATPIDTMTRTWEFEDFLREAFELMRTREGMASNQCYTYTGYTQAMREWEYKPGGGTPYPPT